MVQGDIAALTVTGVLHGQTVQSVLHYRKINQGAGNELALIQAWQTSVKPQYLNCCSAEYEMTQLAAQIVGPGAPEAPFVQPIGFSNGEGSANSLPSSVAACITKRSLTPGKKGRGRVYMPAVPTTFEVDSKLNDTGFQTYAALGDILKTVLAAGATNFEFGIFHRSNKTFSPVISCLAREVLRTQRRRQVGVGV